MIRHNYVRTFRKRGVRYFSYRIDAKNTKDITPKNKNFKAVFFGFLKRNDGNEKRKKHNRPKEENEGNVYLPQQG
jgi:hypothetical protein